MVERYAQNGVSFNSVDSLKKTTTYDAMEYFMDEIENPKVNNMDERWECATTIETWYSELELK